MLKNIFIFLIFISTIVQAVPKEENITEYRIQQLEENIAVLKIQNENLLKSTYKLESQIEILDNKYKEEKENYKNLLTNNESIYNNQLTAFNLILFLVGAILVFISIVGYNNIKKKIDSKVEEKINEKANKKIEELETLTKRHDKLVCEHENILETLKQKSPNNLTQEDIKILDKISKQLENKKDKTNEDWFFIGLEYQNKNENTKAIKAYEKAIQINQNDTNSYYNLGCAYAKLGEFEKAISAYNSVISLEPTETKAYINLIEVCIISNLDIDNKLITKYKELIGSNQSELAKLEMLEVFKDVRNMDYRTKLDKWKSKYENKELLHWSFDELDIWYNKEKDIQIKESLNTLLIYFKKEDNKS